MCSQATLNQITDRVVREVRENFEDKLDKVILYGSYARGDYAEESDIDIMALVDVPSEDANIFDMQFTRFTNRLGMEYDLVVSLLIKDCETFYKFLPADPFYQNIIRDGVTLGA